MKGSIPGRAGGPTVAGPLCCLEDFCSASTIIERVQTEIAEAQADGASSISEGDQTISLAHRLFFAQHP